MVADDSSPPEVPDFTLLKCIGSGGYGTVWLARSATGMFRAVKIVRRSEFADVRPYDREYEGVKRFEKISIGEPSQLALLHVGRNDERGFFYYVMELADDSVRGREIDPTNYQPRLLGELVRRAPLSVREVIDLGLVLCRALATLHRHGLVHRDVKPSNVIFVGGVPKLADIGLVAEVNDERTAVGTIGYMPRAEPASKSADTYALGKVLYELATGFSREDWPRLPPDLEGRSDRKRFFELNAVLLRACGGDRRNGFADAGAMLDELLLLQSGKSVLRLRFLEQRVGQVLRAMTVLALIAGIASAGAWIQFKRAEKAEAELEQAMRRSLYVSSLEQVAQAIEHGGFGVARRLLEETKATLGDAAPGWEWKALHHFAAGDPARVLRADGPAIERILLAPSGDVFAVKDEQRVVSIVDLRTLHEVVRIPGIHRLAGFSANGEWLLGSNERFALQRWSLAKGVPDSFELNDAVYRPLGRVDEYDLVAFADGPNPSVVVFNFETKQAPRRIPLDEEAGWEFFRSAWKAESGELLVACVQGRSSGNRMRALHVSVRNGMVRRFAMDGPISEIGFDADGPWASSATTGQGLRFQNGQWSLDAGNRSPPLNPRVRARGAEVVVSDSGSERVLRGHGAAVSSVLDAGAQGIVSGTVSGELRWWPAHTPPRPLPEIWHGNGVRPRVVFSEEGGRLLAPVDGRSAAVVETAQGTVLQTIPGVRRVLRLEKDLAWCETSDATNLVEYALAARQGRRLFPESTIAIVNLVVSGDPAHACVARADGRLQVLDLARGALRSDVQAGFQNSWSLQLDWTRRLVWAAWSDQSVSCVSAETGAKRWEVRHASPVHCIQWLSTPAVLAIALGEGVIELRDGMTGALLRRVSIPYGTIEDLTPAPDGRRLLAAAGTKGVCVVDPSAGGILARVPLPTSEPLMRIALSPDGSRIALVDPRGVLTLCVID